MAEIIKLVRKDNRPEITLTITDQSTNLPMNLAGATVVVKFRKAGTTTTLATLACTNVTDGTDGKTRFKFTGAALDVEAGNYEGEVEITYPDSDVQTVYEVLKFRLREEFA